MKRTLAASFVLLLTMATGLADEALGPLTEFGTFFRVHTSELSKTRGTISVTEPFPERTPRYYRLRFSVSNPEQSAWTITIRSPAGQALSTFDQSETACESESGCWTIRLVSRNLVVQFSTDSDTTRAKIVHGLFMPEEATNTFYSQMPGSRDEKIGAANIADDFERLELHQRSDNLGLFIGSGNSPQGQPVNWCCSGVRLTEDLFMTNWHCGAARGRDDAAFWSTQPRADTCATAVVDLSWDEDSTGREYGCRAVEYNNKALDVAILRLNRLTDGPSLSRPLHRPQLATKPVHAGAPISILHHPACKPKSVTMGCTVVSAEVDGWTGAQPATTEFTHNCTTEGGSSGGPVFSETGAVVGLHHMGVDESRAPGNFAVSIPQILEAIRSEAPALHGEIVGAQPDSP